MMPTHTVIVTAEGWRVAGENLAKGVAQWLAFWVFIVLVLLTLVEWSGLRSRDDTDSPTERSGLRPRTDHGTGCQYLETAGGGLTPRLGRDGKQVCRP